jgi:predicted PurR-regulated permease PerM
MIQRFFNYLLKNQLLLALFLIALGWLIFQIRDILLSLFLAYIIMAALLPAVEFLRIKRVPKILSVLIPYFSVVLLIFLLIIPLVPFLIMQLQALIIGFPVYLKQSASLMGLHVDPRQIEGYLTSQMNSFSRDVFDFTGKVFGGFFSLITVFIISFYLLMYHDQFKKFIARLFHPKSREYVLDTIDNVNAKLGSWLRGQIFLSIFIGVMSWIALTLLGVSYALPLALLAGLLEVVPTLGPTLSAIPAVVVALTVSPTLAITVVIAYFAIQAIEGHFLVPNVMQRSVGLNPVIVILGIMVGANLMGIAGALLAIPFLSFVLVLFRSIEPKIQ